MLRSITIQNEDEDDLIYIPVNAPQGTNPYLLKGLDGFGPVDTNIVTSPYSSRPGVHYHQGQTGPRNAVITLGYKPQYASGGSYSSLRKDIYRAVPPGALVRIVVDDTDMPDHGILEPDHKVDIWGYVESVDPVYFSDDPQVQISILCTHPYFKTTGWDLQGTSTSTVLELSNSSSTAPMPYKVKLRAPSGGSITSIKIYQGRGTDMDPRTLILSWSGTVTTSQYFIFDTTPGSRGVRTTDRWVEGQSTTFIERMGGVEEAQFDKVLFKPNERLVMVALGPGNVSEWVARYTPEYVGV